MLGKASVCLLIAACAPAPCAPPPTAAPPEIDPFSRRLVDAAVGPKAEDALLRYEITGHYRYRGNGGEVRRQSASGLR